MVDQQAPGGGSMSTTTSQDSRVDDGMPRTIGAGIVVAETMKKPQVAPAEPEPVAPNPASMIAKMPAPGRADETFEEFFHAMYRGLLKQARYAGADEYEADDAAAATMADVYENWHRLDDPAAWAKRAVVRFYVKAKTHNLDRTRARQVRHGVGVPTGRTDTNLTNWEEWQWVTQILLSTLTAEQRSVMALIMDGYSPTEIATRIGTSPEAVRQRLSAARRCVVEVWTQPDAAPSISKKDGQA